MTCPQCHEHIPAKLLWTSTGLSCVVCPHCHVALTPKPLSAILVFAISFGLGDVALLLLRHKGIDFGLAFAGFFVVFAGVFALAAPVMLRLRLRDHAAPPLTGHGHRA